MGAYTKERCLIGGAIGLRGPTIPQLCGIGVNAREATIGTTCIADEERSARA